MIYNTFKDLSLSALGMGCMRLPTVEGDNANIDKDASRTMVRYAMEHGINYYDTAWGYHGGKSETVMGELLAEYPRDSFYLASKFPGFSEENVHNVQGIFEQQLQKCRVDYFDFYLFHSVTENNIDWYLDPALGIYDYLVEQKRRGRIRHLGFSTHGSLDTMKRFLDAYAAELEFCQIQLNWFDYDYQQAKQKVELISSYGLPVWVMEPVRGGSLAKLDPFFMAKLRALRPTATPAEWAFRFLQTLPEVTMTLSGMSNFEQLRENIDTYAQAKPLNKAEMQTLFDIYAAMASKKLQPCTACRYCTERCPQGLDIPALIERYNQSMYDAADTAPLAAIRALPEEQQPGACLGCAACEAVCPQNIKIAEIMADLAARTV